MPLLEKRNRRATRRSVVVACIQGMVIGGLLFVIHILTKPAVREHWPLVLLAWVFLGGVVGTLCEWQGTC